MSIRLSGMSAAVSAISGITEKLYRKMITILLRFPMPAQRIQSGMNDATGK
jgi:hypothetical protein